MKKYKKYIAAVTIPVLMTVLVGGCVEAPPVASTIPAGMGRLEVRVTDAPGDVEAILVTVTEVEVHKEVAGEGKWTSLTITGPNPFDLIKIRDKEQELVTQDLETAKYTQIRMTVEMVEVTYLEDGVPTTVEAILPSGKLKFVRPFDVVEGGTTTLVIDFDADKSVVFTGAKQSEEFKVIFKPVVKLSVEQGGKEGPDELDYSLGTTEGSATAGPSDGQARSGEESIHLLTTGVVGSGDEARIVIIPLPEGTTLDDIDSISWWEYLVEGYPPHVDIILDFDDDNVADDGLVFEYAYNSMTHFDTEAPMPYGAVLDDWFQTFSDDGNGPAQVDDDSSAWLSSGSPGLPAWIQGTLAQWKAGTVHGSVSASTPILRIEVEIDNWVVQSEAYVDDIVIVIDGVTYTIDI